MRRKILLTGKNQRIASSISEHLEDDQGYEVIRCAPNMEAIAAAVTAHSPQIVIICLSSENPESCRVYDVIKECPDADDIRVIVVANGEDLKAFKKGSRLSEPRYLPRPVSIVALYDMLGQIEDELGELQIEETAGTQLFGDREDELPKRKHILVVDDDPEQLSQIKSHLKEFYDVTAVRSGPEALDYLESHSVDLILLDYMMPQMDGPEVLYRLRTTRAYFRLPVVFLTGVNEREKVIKTLVELKPQGYIIKPARKSEIIAKIIDVFEKQV